MGWLRYNDTLEAPNARTVGAAFVIMSFGGTVLYAYDLWRDWQHHRFSWGHFGGLLASLYLVILLCIAAHRAWPKHPRIEDWLIREISVAEAESENTHEGVPFGFMNDQWRRLKNKAKHGDAFWLFSSPAEMWADLKGLAGVALVRNGKVVGIVRTLQN